MSALRAVVSVDEAPLSPARAILAQAIEAHRAAVAAVDEVQRPLSRLWDVVHRVEAAERRLAELRQAHDQEIGTWIASGADGARPAPPEELLAVERELAAAGRDKAGAAAALPAAEAKLSDRAAVLKEATVRRTAAVYQVAVEAAVEAVAAELVPAIRQVLAVESKPHSVVQALRQLTVGAAADPAAMVPALAIEEAIRSAKRDASAAPDLEIGRRFLNALARDAGAKIDGEG